MRLIACLGVPCGGTWRVGESLRRSGIDVGHEQMRSDGIACGFFAWGQKLEPADYRFRYRLRYIRDPIATSETLPHHCLGNEPRAPWYHPACQIAAMRRWVLTHERITGEDFVLRVGPQFDEDWRYLARFLPLPATPPRFNQRSKQPRMPPITWSEWRARDPDFAERGAALCARFGLT